MQRETIIDPKSVLLHPKTVLQICWWFLFAFPVVGLLLALDSRRAGSADEAIPFLLFPPLVFSWVLGPVVIYKGFKSGRSPAQRWLHLGLGLALLPMWYLVGNMYDTFGWRSREEAFGWEHLLWLAALLTWLLAVWMVRPRVLRATGQ